VKFAWYPDISFVQPLLKAAGKKGHNHVLLASIIGELSPSCLGLTAIQKSGAMSPTLR